MWTDEWRRRVIAYSITLLFEELEYKEIVTWKEIHKLYELLGNQCGLFDLLPRNLPPDPKQLLFRIQHRRSLDMATTPGSHAGVILHRKEGVSPPDAYLEKLCTQFNTCNGQAMVEKGAVDTLQDNSALDLDGLKELLKDFPNEMVLFFGKNDVEYHGDDLQPFELISKDKKILLAVFIEGNFPDTFKHDESAHSKPFFVVNEYLREKILDMWELFSENIDNMTTALNKTSTQRDLLSTCIGERGSLVFVASNGKIIQISKNPQSAGFDNGAWWTSNTLGYTGEVASPTATAETPAVDAKPLSAAERRRQQLAAKRGPPVAAAAPVSPAKETKASVPVTSTPAAAVAQAVKTEKTETKAAPNEADTTGITIPTNYNENARKSWFYRNFQLPINKQNGKPQLPQGWETMTSMPANLLKPESKLWERIKSMDKLGTIKDSVSKAVQDTPPNIIGPAERDACRKLLADYGVDSPKLLTMEQLTKIHGQELTFSEQLGYPLELALFLPKNMFNAIIRTHPHVANALIDSARHLILQYLSDEVMAEIDGIRAEAAEKNKAVNKNNGGTQRGVAAVI